MGGLDSLDWDAVKLETKKREAQLEEWCMNGEVKYLQGWAFALAERKAEYAGIPLNSKTYFQLQTMTRSRVFKSLYQHFQEQIARHPQTLLGLKCKLASYQEIDSMVEREMELITRPPQKAKVSEKKAASEITDFIYQTECSLSEFLSNEEIALLRNASFEFAERKAHTLKLSRGSEEYKRLQTAARYELMCEAEESILGFAPQSFDYCSQIARDLTEHNDLDIVFKEYESRAFKKS
jgi:hypothetical protein